MRIGDKFKIRVKLFENQRYIISDISNEFVEVSWNTSNELRKTSYPIDDVKKLFNSGVWLNLTEIRRNKLKKLNEL